VTTSDREDLLELSIVLPCLDEEQTLGECIAKARTSIDRMGVRAEIVVADNGSTDGSRDIALRAGARVVDVPKRGYGAALRAGITAARGRYVVMADADNSYALDEIDEFVAALRQGNDLVMGNRFAGGIAPGAMPALHRYLGNPVLSFLGRLFFRIPVRDFHCGLRAFDREKAVALNLRSDGMEFASELVVKFALVGHRIAEVPTRLARDGRDRPPHLRSWRDGWRHLRFLLLYSPRWLFLYPGVGLTVVGLVLMAVLSFGPVVVGSVALDTQSLLFSAGMVTVGVQAVLFAILSRTYAAARGMLPGNRPVLMTAHPQALERGALAGLLLLLIGVAGSVGAVVRWATYDFGELDLASSLRWSIPAITCLVVGAQVLMASFFLGLLQFDREISHREQPASPGRLVT